MSHFCFHVIAVLPFLLLCPSSPITALRHRNLGQLRLHLLIRCGLGLAFPHCACAPSVPALTTSWHRSYFPFLATQAQPLRKKFLKTTDCGSVYFCFDDKSASNSILNNKVSSSQTWFKPKKCDYFQSLIVAHIYWMRIKCQALFNVLVAGHVP